jgi:hypothetical protein
VGPAQSPIPDWLTTDPIFELSLVPLRLYNVDAITPEEARRMLRLYFPRTEKILQSFSCVLFSGGDVRHFDPDKIQRITTAIDAGTAAATDMGGMSKPLHDTWIASGIWEVFPNDVHVIDSLWDAMTPTDQSFRITVNTGLDRNPLLPFIPLGIERLLGGRTRIIHPRQGSEVYAWMEAESLLGRDLGFRPAAAVAWFYGKGRTVALEGWFGHSWWSAIIDPTDNDYGQDILINHLLEATRGLYFEDISRVHLVRQTFSRFQEHLSFLQELTGFVERFGANTNALTREAADTEERFQLAHSHYLEGDLDSALAVADESVATLKALRDKAMQLRSRALQWIYVIEWLSVAGALMVAGFALDQLMIRRRLYRRPSATRMRTGSAETQDRLS